MSVNSPIGLHETFIFEKYKTLNKTRYLHVQTETSCLVYNRTRFNERSYKNSLFRINTHYKDTVGRIETSTNISRTSNTKKYSAAAPQDCNILSVSVDCFGWDYNKAAVECYWFLYTKGIKNIYSLQKKCHCVCYIKEPRRSTQE